MNDEIFPGIKGNWKYWDMDGWKHMARMLMLAEINDNYYSLLKINKLTNMASYLLTLKTGVINGPKI